MLIFLNLKLTFNYYQLLQKLLKRGIILKCQGNPVSCYGKRAIAAKLEEQSPVYDAEEELEQEKESNFEKGVENLIRNCKSGSDKSCSAILKMMLMNLNRK